jgi:hypothetical protein
MATISIADNDARIQHDIGSGGNTAGSTTFPIDFPFFALDDIDVTITNSSGVDTALTRGTGTNTFSVSGTAVDDGFSAGNVILNTQYTSSTVTISRDIEISRTSDFATSGPFNISSLNTDLDKIYAVMQQLETNNARALSLPTTDTLTSITLPTNTSRRGKYLAFNASTGDAEIGGSVADTGTVATISGNITTVAGIASDVSAVEDIKANVTTVAGIASNVTTVAGIQANVTTVANNASAVNGASANATLALNYATKVDGVVPSTSDFSSKAQAVGGTGVTGVTGSAREWALGGGSSPNSTVHVDSGDEYSSKGYAVGALDRGSNTGKHSAKDWASYTAGTVNGSEYSAKYWATQASATKASFDSVYQGAGSSDPTGGTVSAGDLFFNTTSSTLKFYNGSAWVAIEATDTSSFASKGFSTAMAVAL